MNIQLDYKKTLLRILGVCFLFALWHFCSIFYNSLILPSPIETMVRLYEIFAKENGLSQVWITIARAAMGFSLSVAVGFVMGILAGVYNPARNLLHPFERIMVSVPPIAWLVLTIIWFGGTGVMSATLTIFISCFPMVYLSTVQGVTTLDKRLLDMGRTFGMSHMMVLFKIGLMHVLSVVFPAIIISLGQSWKVGIMAEVLGASNGIGSQISTARVHLETPDVFAWITVAVILFLITDKLFIDPINQYNMKWR